MRISMLVSAFAVSAVVSLVACASHDDEPAAGNEESALGPGGSSGGCGTSGGVGGGGGVGASCACNADCQTGLVCCVPGPSRPCGSTPYGHCTLSKDCLLK